MTLISILFLLTEILIIGIGALIGYRRGVGRSAVRVAYIAIIGVATFFIAKKIASAIAPAAFELIYNAIPVEDVKHLLDKAPELDRLVENLIGALATPFVFAILFLVLQLLSLICFKLVSSKIVGAISKAEAPTKATRWMGAGVGLVTSIAVAAILLSPVYTMFHVVENTPDEAIDAVLDTFGISEPAQELNTNTRALKAGAPLVAPTFRSVLPVTKLHPVSDLITRLATTFEVPEAHAKESAMHTLHILADVAGDVLYVHHSTVDHGGTSMDALSNSVAAVTPHLNESLLVKDAAACALSALGEILIEDGKFMGITLPQNENAVVNEITHNVLDTMAHTTLDSVEENMTMLFGVVGDDLLPEQKRHDVSGKEGLLVAVDHMKSAALAPQEMLKQALVLFDGNEEMTAVLNNALSEYLKEQIPDDLGIDKDVVGDIISSVVGDSNIDISNIDLNNISKENILDLIEENNITLDETTLEYIQGILGKDVTMEDVDNFLGNTDSEETGDVDLGDVDLGDVDLGDIDLGDVDLGDIDLGDISIEDVENIDISDIDIYSLDPSALKELDPAVIDALRAKYGGIIDTLLRY